MSDLRELHAKSTPGEWSIVQNGATFTLVAHADGAQRVCFTAIPGSIRDEAEIMANASLIAAAHNDLPEILAEHLRWEMHMAEHAEQYGAAMDEIARLQLFELEVDRLREAMATAVSELDGAAKAAGHGSWLAGVLSAEANRLREMVPA